MRRWQELVNESFKYIDKFIERIWIFSAGILSVSLSIFLSVSHEIAIDSRLKIIIIWYLIFFVIALISSVITHFVQAYYINSKATLFWIQAEIVLNDWWDKYGLDPDASKLIKLDTLYDPDSMRQEYNIADKKFVFWYDCFNVFQIISIVFFCLGIVLMIIMFIYIVNNIWNTPISPTCLTWSILTWKN